MGAIFVAGILFGLIHPGAKWITSTGIGLLPFCLFYVLLRILLQLPVVLATGKIKIESRSQLKFLVSMGIVGGVLRITEFAGIVEGVPVSLVSFLIFLHPAWTVLFSRWLNQEPITHDKVIRVFIALLGLLLLSGDHWANLTSVLSLWGPIAAGMMISLWICLSSSAPRHHCSVVSISFYYDLFSFIALAIVCLAGLSAREFSTSVQWFLKPAHFLNVTVFAALTGLIPNYLFYFGARQTSAITAALLILFEPIVSSVIAWYAWQDPITPTFIAGAACILLINVPTSVVSQVRALHRRHVIEPPQQPTEEISKTAV